MRKAAGEVEPMSKEVTIWIVIGVYALFMLGIGVWYSRKGTDMAGFTVGGRNAGAWISALSYGTAYFSAVMFIGYSGGSGWSYGLWSVLVGVAALIVLVVQSPQVGGLSQGLSNMVDYMESHQMAPLSGSSALALVSTVLMTSFGTWGLPQMVHKYYGIRDKREVSRGVIISTFFSLLVAGGGYFIGSFSHLFFGENLPEGGTDYIVPLMLNSAGLPNLLIGVILVLLISASVSTLSSITLTACSTVSMDLIKASWLKGLGEKTLATVTRLLCLAFVVLSYLIANYPTPILEMMSYSWGILSGAFLAPYVLTLYWKGINRAGAWAGMIGGFLTAFVPAAASGFTTPNGPVYACLAMALSFLLCLGVSPLARKLGWKAGAANPAFYAKQKES